MQKAILFSALVLFTSIILILQSAHTLKSYKVDPSVLPYTNSPERFLLLDHYLYGAQVTFAPIAGPSATVSQTFTTDYTPPPQYYLQPIPITSPYNPLSPAQSVANFNNKNAAYLITCPDAPPFNPTLTSYPQEYIYTQYAQTYSPFIAGDSCQADSKPLTSTIQITTQIVPPKSSGVLPSPTATVQILNPALVVTNTFAYSPQIYNISPNAHDGNYISTAYSTNSYIFDQFPANTPQQGVWGWYAKFANLQNINPASLPRPIEDRGDYVFTTTDPNGNACNWHYTYTADTTLNKIQNGQIPFAATNPAGSKNQYLLGQFFDNPVLPYLIYGSNIINPANPPKTLNLNLSYDTYSPWNYYTPPANFIPFPLNYNSLFYINYFGSINGQQCNPSCLNSYYKDPISIGINTNAQQFIFDVAQTVATSSEGSGGGGGGGSGGGTCPNTVYTIGDSSSQLSTAQAIACASAANFQGTAQQIVVAIASAESSLKPGTYAGNGNPLPPPGTDTCWSAGSWDRGIMQINSCAHGEVPDTCAYNPTCAFQQAYKISSSGTNFLPWCTYDPGCNPSSTATGAYCQYMPTSYSGPYCPQGGGQTIAGSGTPPPSGGSATISSSSTSSTGSSSSTSSTATGACGISGSTLTGIQFFDCVLQDLGVPSQNWPADVKVLSVWSKYESPELILNGQPFYNPLSTTQQAPCSIPLPGNSANVQMYLNAYIGAQATATVIQNGYYPNILQGLMTGADPSYYTQSPAKADFGTWVSNGNPQGYSDSFYNDLTNPNAVSADVSYWSGLSAPIGAQCNNGGGGGGGGGSGSGQGGNPPTGDPAMIQPVSIAVTPSDYVFVLVANGGQTNSGGGGGGGGGSGTYAYPVGSGCNIGRTDQGKDWSGGPCTLYAVGAGKILSVYNTGWNFCGNDAFIVLQLDNPLPPNGVSGGNQRSRVYYAEGITPLVSEGQVVTTGQPIATEPAGGCTEIGWADTAAIGDSLWQQLNPGVSYDETGGNPTLQGQDFVDFINSLNGGPSPPPPPPSVQSSGYYLAIARTANQGYYNTSAYQPTSVPTVSITSTDPNNPPSTTTLTNKWEKKWKDYWNTVNSLQNGSTYIIKKISLNDIAANIDLSKYHLKCDSALFNPHNISADDAGDVYIVGDVICSVASDHLPFPWLVRVTKVFDAQPTIKSTMITNGDCTGSDIRSCLFTDPRGGTTHFNEIAASPTGDLVFIASQDNPGIFAFSGDKLLYTATITLTYDQDISNAGLADLQVNLAYWFTHGGLYGIDSSGSSQIDQKMQQIFAYDPQYTKKPFDDQRYHHPIGIQDVNGYLYVMDNWKGQLNNHCLIFSLDCGGDSLFNTLLLRVINSTGVDVPLNPTQFNDLWAGNNQWNPTPGTVFNFPPYGWIISASVDKGHPPSFFSSPSKPISNTTPGISFSSASKFASVSTSGIALCSGSTSNCDMPRVTFNPSYNRNYYPLGPQLSDWECTGNIIWHRCTVRPIKALGFSVGFNDTVSLFFSAEDGSAEYYKELLFANFSVQNYTKGIGPEGPPLAGYSVTQQACYTDSQQDAIPLSGDRRFSCSYDKHVSNFARPISLLSNPFYYLESVGSLRTLTFEEFYYSSIIGANAGTGISSAEEQNIANQYTNQNYLKNNQQTASSTPNSAVGAVNIGISGINSLINGYLVFPYQYGYSITQSISNIHPDSGNPVTCGSTPPTQLTNAQPTIQGITYSYSTAPAKSNDLPAGIEGAPTYAQYVINQSYYQENLSTTFIPRDILYDIHTNRNFGEIYVNATTTRNGNAQAVVNALEQLSYNVGGSTQGNLPGFESMVHQALIPQCAGTQCAFGADTSKVINLRNNFSYIPTTLTTTVALFNFYKAFAHINALYLQFNGTKVGNSESIYGYHRLVYVYKDRFNNSIYMPIDADIANLTNITVTVSPIIDPTNANHTTLNANGTAIWLPPFNQAPIPLKNGEIYIYYNQNINYVNYDPTADPVDSMLCTFGITSQNPTGHSFPSNCQLSNPIYTGRTTNAKVIDYQPSYNSVPGATPNTCAGPAPSLFTQKIYNCNIYGADNLPITCAISPSSATDPFDKNGNPNPQWHFNQGVRPGVPYYCNPIFVNGTGLCTSQMGLVGITTTDNNGNFKLAKPFDVCGSGQVTLTAQFYGTPAPEPIKVTQAPIDKSADPNSAYLKMFDAFNYDWTPAFTSVTVTVGELLLGYGQVNALYLIVGIIAIMIILALQWRNKLARGSHKRHTS